MTLISGPLSTVTADPTAVSVVQVSVQGPRTVGTGVQTHESKNVAVSGGVFSHEIAPGPATLTMIVGQQPGPPIPILVGDVASQTLAEVVDAARLATGYSAENLAQFVQQVLEARHDVLDAVAGFGQVEEDALTAIGEASAGALAGIGDAREGALTAVGVEVTKAEDAADRAESAVNDGVGDGAVTLQKLAPDVTAQINSKADLVGGKVPTSQIPEVALTKPFSVTSRAALLALDVQEGDIGIITTGADKGTYILGSGPSNVFTSWVQLAVSADAPVSSVNGQTGTVVLNATNVGAAPTTHTHTVAQITDLPTVTQSNVADAIVQRQANGNIQVPTSPSVGTDASSKAYVDQKILETGVVVEWAEARTVTITASTTSAFTEGSQTGSTGLIAAWSDTTAVKKVAFTKNVVCDKKTRPSGVVSYEAGEVIPAGTAVQPTAAGGIGPYTFTELGTTLGTLLGNYAMQSVDTSVGTRIFAGTTMIHGDTGWRNITFLLNEGTTPAAAPIAQMRRLGDVVTFKIRMNAPSDKNMTITVPQGFAASTYVNHALMNVGGTLVSANTLAALNIIDFHQSMGKLIQMEFSYTTNQGWPTSLPGTPA
ncbi:hypothetical protein ACOI1A_01000 [Corynebacterium glutamicum]|uniref:hypothetical protein n=1 Tax=Corynebacterium glutamicum TaxID=1718 RepID=UPI003B58B98C